MPGVIERMLATMRSFFGEFAKASPRGSVFELPGVTACLVPALGQRSVFNCVVYERAEDLEAGLDEVAAAYDGAGVEAWTVWSHESDLRAADVLERAGHKLDASPAAMVLDLASFDDPPTAGGFEIDDDPSTEDAIPVLESSYGWSIRPGFGGWGAGTWPYMARVDGRAAAVLGIHDLAGDAGVFMVGTAPEARGRGLATALMQRALFDARERGCDISSLQATRMGAAVYARLGYRTHGRVNMWERRRS